LAFLTEAGAQPIAEGLKSGVNLARQPAVRGLLQPLECSISIEAAGEIFRCGTAHP
jgi:hypothetical protein